MKKEKLAEKLNGGDYGSEVSRLLAQEAKQSGLVIVYGASDDLMEFDGAIRDEAGCFDGGDVYIDRNGPMQSECSEGNECPCFQEKLALAMKITAIWHDGEDSSVGPAWSYKTKLPHAKFMIYEDGDCPYCEGIVFHIDDVR